MTNEELSIVTTPITPTSLIEENSANLQQAENVAVEVVKEDEPDHTAISKELALAIGHRNTYMEEEDGTLYVRTEAVESVMAWFPFDYRDPAIIWPIAERFDCFPYKTASGNWTTSLLAPSGATEHGVKSAALAVALTVIQEQGL